MSWRLARSLVTLRAQYDAADPGRDKSWDGTIGDTAHAARKSDHNPDGNGVVKAIDLTASGRAGLVLADAARATMIARGQAGYVIHQGRICSSSVQDWKWRRYGGASPHDHHVHVSVHSQIDSTRAWQLGVQSIPGVTVPAASVPVVRPKGLLKVDGILGERTRMAIAHATGMTKLTSDKAWWRAVQRWAGLTGADVDGKRGPITDAAISRKIGDPRHTAWSSKLIASWQRWLNENGHTR